MTQPVALHPAVVRPAGQADIPALLRLLFRYFDEGGVRHRDDEALLWEQMKQPVLGWYVAEAAAGLAGCVFARFLKDLPGAAECKRLYVAPESRGSGLGARLMVAVETAAHAQGLAWMYLDSKESFSVAMAMYARRGYSSCPRFNRNPEATFFFRKRLG